MIHNVHFLFLLMEDSGPMGQLSLSVGGKGGGGGGCGVGQGRTSWKILENPGKSIRYSRENEQRSAKTCNLIRESQSIAKHRKASQSIAKHLKESRRRLQNLFNWHRSTFQSNDSEESQRIPKNPPGIPRESPKRPQRIFREPLQRIHR